MAELVQQPFWVVGVMLVWLAVCWGIGAGAVFFIGPDRELEDG